MERAIRIRPRLTEGHFLLGKAYESMDPQKSLKYYQIFRRQASADPEFIAMLSEVKARISSLTSTLPPKSQALAPKKSSGTGK
jgi:hypothetical protein